MNKKVLLSFLILCNVCTHLHADIVEMHDGNIINGTIIKKKRHFIIIRNKYGTFKVKRKKISTLRISTQKKGTKIEIIEDGIDLSVPLMPAAENRVRRGPYAPSLWKFFSSLSFLASFDRTWHEYNEIIPYGGGGTVQCALLPFSIGKTGPVSIGGEVILYATGMYYSKGENSLLSLSGGPGFQGVFTMERKKYGEALLLLAQGTHYLKAQAENYNDTGLSFSGTASPGYRYSMGKIHFLIYATYRYTYDSIESLHCTGISAGSGINF